MRYKFYTTSEKAWDAMLEAIKSAQRSVYLEMYIFADNTPSHNFFEIIEQKAKNGVKIKIILDAFGSSDLTAQTIEKIKSAGVEILFFSHWLRHTHKKILVIDERIAFLGGVNIHKLYQKWNDLQIRLTAKSIVKSMTRSFAHTYRLCGGSDIEILNYEKHSFIGKARLWFLEHRIVMGRRLIKRYYKHKIATARKNIIIVTPYFAPQKWLKGLLHQAVLRGVDVQIIMPERTDHRIFTRMNYFYISSLLPLGVRFYMQKNMNHAKAMLIDDMEGVIGSQNIDPFSFNHDIEAGIFFTEKGMVDALKGIIKEWKKNATLFDKSMINNKWSDYVVAPIIKFFESIL